MTIMQVEREVTRREEVRVVICDGCHLESPIEAEAKPEGWWTLKPFNTFPNSPQHKHFCARCAAARLL